MTLLLKVISWNGNMAILQMYNIEWKSLKLIEDINTTSFADSFFIFGDLVSMRVLTRSKNDSYRIASKAATGYFGKEMPIFENIEYDPIDKRYFLLGKYYAVLDADNMQVLFSHPTSPVLSKDCQSAYVRKDNTKIVVVNPLDLSPIKEYNVQDIVGSHIRRIVGIVGANNGRFIFQGYTYRNPTYYYEKTYYVDLEKNKILDEMGNIPHMWEISSDGEYVLISDSSIRLVKYLPEWGLVYWQNLTSIKNFSLYHTENAFIFTNNKRIRVFDLETKQRIKEFVIEDDLVYPDVDLETNCLGGFVIINNENQDCKYRIYDLNSGQKVYEAKVLRGSGGQNYWLQNNKILTKNGFYLPIDIN